MTGAEILLIGLRLHTVPDDGFHAELAMFDPLQPNSLDDLVDLCEPLIKEGRSHLRPWIAVARQLEAAESKKEGAVRDFMVEMYEKARALGWTPDQDLMQWLEGRSGLSSVELGGPLSGQAVEDPLPRDGGWA